MLPLSTLSRTLPAMLAAPEFALIYTVQWGKRERGRESGLTDGLVDIRIRSLLRTTQKIWKKGKGEGKTKADVRSSGCLTHCRRLSVISGRGCGVPARETCAPGGSSANFPHMAQNLGGLFAFRRRRRRGKREREREREKESLNGAKNISLLFHFP